ncbi:MULTISPECIES: DUF4245 domain-containing protein [unclassified Corynebacterium]|uniref:DUF4245 domain-containing protein n=1 Tax=unclassified Corynebacterium TaxID=2624378 RepID=UPI0021AA40B9|nr:MULTISPECIES: DUF4245 domain-containing protein [unclassified Corynebacterium]MCT1452753.1 DUF4245 domain-containing protein [Corynebacterium sp. p3-SID1145]MCT1461667.1 DUF4245 domain-containing protein [Corynebacterium sp. p3-SID1140]MDN8595626.1 DUF4245 domain-containing protein [Corynebacterium sp. P4_F2]WKK56421.1 DUF4245 domain-containing protein [Corynebacterium sp. P4-C1]WKK63854.1 DUF4245 domain-containing protein [Corynebacterium sp. P8-C1]
MAKEKPRIFQDGKDMTINVIVIVLLMVGAVGFTGMCSFNPGRPENGPVQEVDGATFMGMEARAVKFPVRFPRMPEGWVNNSARRTTVGEDPAPVVGWVTPKEGYLQLTQTGADVETAVERVDSSPREKTGTALIDDAQSLEATIYSSPEADVRDVWVVDLGDVRLLVKGEAREDEFRELLATTVATEPLPAT